MTPRSSASLRRQLLREYAALRRALLARHVLRAFAACAVAIAVAVLAGVLWPGGTGFATTRLALLVLAALASLGFALARLRAELPRFEPWLQSLETRLPELRSWLRNALDMEAAPASHTSESLAGALRDEASRRLAAAPIAAGRPRVHAARPLSAATAALAVFVALAALAPSPALRAWRTLWNPSLAAPPVTLVVEPGSVTVSPGATLAVRASVGGSASAPRLTGDGANPAPQLESVERGVHRWRFDLPPVTRARRYAVRVLAARSPEYRIGLAGEPQPVSFSFEYRAPGYARLPAQSGASTRGDIAALRGSVAAIEVTFDRDIEALVATLPGGRAQAWSAVTPRRWRGKVGVERDGEWSLRAEAATGAGTSRWRVSVLPDAPPVITVALPAGDQDLPPGSRIPYDVFVQDDLGLSDLRLQFRKEAAQPWRDVPLSAFPGEPREARVSAAWDAAALALLPGESGTFRFVVRDNDRLGGPASATSPEFRLRFPSMAELYQNLDRRQDDVQQSLGRVADQARELQRTLDQLQRQQPRPGAANAPRYERTEEMRKALERQQALSEKVAKAAEDVSQNSADAAERQAFSQQLQDKLHEMSELMKQIQSSEFRDAAQRMREALERMDRTNMEQQLPRLREANRDLLKSLERNLALLRQLRDEERMEALAKRADELKQQQDAMNREHQALARPESPKKNEGRSPQPSKAELAQRQREAAARSEQLAKETREAAQQTAAEQARKDLQAAADQLDQQAAQQQEQAAQQSESGQSAKASQSGAEASESLQQAADRMRSGTEAAQQERDARQLAAVRRSAQDLVSLGQEASRNISSGESPGEQADQQTDLSEGVARVADSLATLANETPLLPPQVQESLGRAREQLSRSGRELAQGNQAGGKQQGRSATASLRDAVNALRQGESSMCKKPGGKKPGQGDGETPSPGGRLGKLSSQQGQLNERSTELARRLSQAMRLSSGDQAEMRRLADEQARLRAELEDIQRQDESRHQLLGRLDQARRDMQQVEEELRQGTPGADLEERQVNILSRLLDAQRSLNRRDFDPQRESRAGADVTRPAPAPLPASLLRENDRLRLDLMKADEDRYPAQYRALIERYLQRLNGTPR
jgi:hypothetical protein